MIASHKTQYNADSIESRPAHVKHLACATYQLDSTTDQRSGNVALLRFDGSQIVEENILETGGVLDLWWKDETVMFAAKASGELQSINVNDCCKLTAGNELRVSDSILLAVDGTSDFILSSDTKGNIYKVVPHNTSLKVTQTLSSVHGQHGWGYEVWGLAVNKGNSHLVYSGGDDCLLKCHDWRSSTTVFTCKLHNMGVCCISPDPTSPYHFISGSYDETAALWDTRSMRSPLEVCRVGGGVWRVKRSECNKHVLIAGMHSGFHVVDLATFQVTKTYTEHESLAYGADWLEGGLVATCSFYDNLVSVWDSGVKSCNGMTD